METSQKRLDRFENNIPIESIETLLNSLNNYFNPEIKLAEKNKQYSLMILGIHSISLTISEAFWQLNGLAGYKKFLEEFIDDDVAKFSKIAQEIHNKRNNIAHQWLAKSSSYFGFDETINCGWKKEESIIHFNPKTYCQKYLEAFNQGGKIWQYNKKLSYTELYDTKKAIINKYKNN